jgi:hypothetical protein
MKLTLNFVCLAMPSARSPPPFFAIIPAALDQQVRFGEQILAPANGSRLASASSFRGLLGQYGPPNR